MTTKIYNVDEWTWINEGDAVEFLNPRPRNVRLEVNAPSKVELYYVTPDGEAIFLALVEGRRDISFGSIGAFSITVDRGGCNIYTADGADIAQRVLAPVVFTKIAERRRRDPEMERMMAIVERNQRKREDAIMRELHSLRAGIAAAGASPVPPAGRAGSAPRDGGDVPAASELSADSAHVGGASAAGSGGGGSAPSGQGSANE